MTSYLNEEFVRASAAKYDGELTQFSSREENSGVSTYLFMVQEGSNHDAVFDRVAFASWILGDRGSHDTVKKIGQSFVLVSQRGNVDRTADCIYDDFDTTVWIVTFLG